MIELRIDPEFESLIPPLTDAEFKQLRDNILDDGEVLDPIKTWQGVIVDGHNRWKIIQENPDISFKTYEMIFLSRHEAKAWICKNQLGRRNLTPEQQMNLMGKMKQERTKSVGAPEGNKNAEKQMVQNEPIVYVAKSTAAQIAEELGVSESTVKRAEKFAEGIDRLKETSQEAADKVLRGGSGVTKSRIMEIPTMDEPDVEAIAEEIMNPPPKPPKPEPPSYTITSLQMEVRSSGENYIRFLRETLAKRNTLYADSQEAKITLSDELEIICNNIRNIQNILI